MYIYIYVRVFRLKCRSHIYICVCVCLDAVAASTTSPDPRTIACADRAILSQIRREEVLLGLNCCFQRRLVFIDC